MPAYFDTGMFVREPAWHMGGNVVMDWPGSWNLAKAEAGIEWDIIAKPVYKLVPTNASFTAVEGYKFIQRSDNGEIFGVREPSYTPIYNWQFGELIETIMNGLHIPIRFDALVSIKGGRIIAATMALGDDVEIVGDPSPLRQYIVAFTSHDSSYALRIGNCSVRVVCANTQDAANAEFDRDKTGYTIKHTDNWADRAEKAARGIQSAVMTHEAMVTMANALVAQQLSGTAISEFIDHWLPYSSDMTPKQMTNLQARRATFIDIYEGETGKVTMEGIRGTKWGLYQAVTEFCDHYTNSHSLDTQINRTLLAGDNRKGKALTIIGKL
jgi:phage/plasmid-like protein (TIGR03299 family)